MEEKKKNTGRKAFDLISSGLEHLVPRGGVKHLDSVITKGQNRSLYISGGKAPSPVPGSRPVMGKDLLIKGPRGVASKPTRRLRLW
jgi:hypothetical protein